MVKIVCCNRTRTGIVFRDIIHFVEQYLGRYPNFRPRLIDISFVGQKTMQTLNNTYRHINSPTDILTFVHEHQNRIIAEIYINPKQAAKKHYTLKELISHGLDHCRGIHH